jgi:hypothetical protein
MPVLNQPENPNFAFETNVRFILRRAPTLSFFSRSGSLPGIRLDTIDQHSNFIRIPRPGNKIHYEDFDLNFHVDENFENYFEIYNWMNSLGLPDDFNTYPTQQSDIYSDGTLMIMTSSKNPNIEVTFRDMFPIGLSQLDFDIGQTDPQIITATVTFRYQRYYVTRPSA